MSSHLFDSFFDIDIRIDGDLSSISQKRDDIFLRFHGRMYDMREYVRFRRLSAGDKESKNLTESMLSLYVYMKIKGSIFCYDKIGEMRISRNDNFFLPGSTGKDVDDMRITLYRDIDKTIFEELLHRNTLRSKD